MSRPPGRRGTGRPPGPGVVKEGTAGWSGYTYAGEFAVNAKAPDRAMTQRILDSAE